MTIHVISGGVSLIANMRGPAGPFRDNPLLAEVISQERPDQLLVREGAGDTIAAASAWLAAAIGSTHQRTGDRRQAGRLAALAQAVRPDRWPMEVSAELKTLGRVPGAQYPLPTTDIAILVGSDTPDGMLAATWNAAALVSGDLRRVRYLIDPSAPSGHIRGCAVLVRVAGLDAGDEDGFRQAMGGLGALGRNLLRSGDLRDGEPFHFCLTGGFKATIPFLIGIAEGLRSLDSGHPVDAFILHERARPQAPPIRLPLRRLVAAQVEQELSGFDRSGERRGIPSPALLDGYAYEIKGTICTLTAFGAGLRALFGLPPEKAGG